MHKLYQLLLITSVISGCTKRDAKWSNDPTTSRSMCNHTITPLDTGNEKVFAELSLKKDLASGDQIIKATLLFIINGVRDYNIEPQEKLSLSIDEKESLIDIVFSGKKAFEHFENRYIAIPTGQTINLGSTQEKTSKTVTFKLKTDQFNALLTAKAAHFTISSSDQTSRYFASLTPSNINQLQSFKSVCYSTIGTKQ